MWKPKTKIPKFAIEGYAVYTDGDLFADDGNDGLAIVSGKKPGFAEKIYLKPNAPLWAIDEYEQLVKYFAYIENNPDEADDDNYFSYEPKFQ